VRTHARLDSVGQGELVVRFHLARLSILGRRAWLAGVALEAVVSDRSAPTLAEHAVRLGAQELGPAGPDPARRRPQARGAQHARDRGRRDADPELQQLALDAHVAPARVLPRQPLDQAARLGRKRRTAGPATAASATSLQQRPVPAAKRLRADRKARPPLARKQPARRSEQRPVGGRVLRAPPAAPQDRQLVAQNHDLELALTAAAGKQTNKTAEEPVQQTGQQDAQSEPLRTRSPTPPPRPNRISLPHRVAQVSMPLLALLNWATHTSHADPARPCRKLPPVPGNPRKTTGEKPCSRPGIPAYPRSGRKCLDRPVTPE
jgi:hypothetical protein